LVEGTLLQGVLNGLTSAGIYILVALGLALLMSIMNIVQLAHGEIYMIGAYLVYYFTVSVGISFYGAFVIAVLSVGVLGIFLERFFFRPFRGKPDQALVLSIGLMLVFQNIVLAVAGGTPKSYRNQTPFEGVVKVGDVALSTERLVIIIVGFVLVCALFLYIRFAKNGQAMLAISQERDGAALQGININRLSAIAMFVGCALAGVAGGLVGALFTLTPTMGGSVLMKGIAVIILGGLGSVPGAVIGGLIIGLIDGVVPVFTTSYMGSLIGFAIVILILLFRPQGIWGHE
jgi:branched-chain amino acid transport system permease protein